MANLSNINNKFLVTTGGNVLIGQTSVVGSSIFQVTGASTFAGELNVKNASTRFISLNYEDSVNTIKSNAGSPNFGIEALNIKGDVIRFYTDYDSSSPKGNITLTLQNNHNAKFEGNVGIGLSPGANSLHIYKSNPIALIQAANTSGAAQVQFFPRDASNVAHLQSIKGVDSNLTFLTGGNSGNSYVPTERMRIDSSGRTSIIGVFESSTNQGILNLNQSSGVGSLGMGFHDPAPHSWIQSRSKDSYSTSYALSLNPNGGNVGIGTTSPTSKLEVYGTSTAASNTASDAIFDIHSTSTAHLLMGVAGVTPYGAWINTDSTAQPLVLMGTGGNVGIGVTNPTSKLTLPQEEENGFKIEFTGGSYSSGISTVDQAGSGLYIGANSYVNNSGLITYKNSALDSSGIYFDAWSSGSGIEFYTALSGTPQQRMEITGGGAVVINGTTNLIGNLRVGGTALATSNLHVYAGIGNGSSLWSIGASATYAYTAHKQWTSITGTATSAAYYTIGNIEDSRSAIIVIKTAAHSNATILVSRGYGPSNLSRFQVLSSTKNPNGGYANITGVRISGGGLVDIKLEWGSGPNVAVEIAVYGLGFIVPSTLAISVSNTGTYPYNVLQTHDFPSDAASAMVAGQLRVTGNIVNPATFGTTTGSAANMHIDSNGTFFRSTSSLKYKKDVRDYDKGLNEVMQLKPKYYKGKDDGDIQFAGLIAEDVHDLGLNEFVQYAEDDTPDALAYPNMIALLVKSIQELKAEIDLLKNS